MRGVVLLIALCIASTDPSAAEGIGRIKGKPPTPAEADRIAAEIAMNDSLLRRGDIVVTEKGFVVFRGVAADGVTNEFDPVQNPLEGSRKQEAGSRK